MQMLRLQPAAGRRVRDPRSGQVCPETFADYPPTQYWLRRLRDGDMVEPPAPIESADELVDVSAPADTREE